MNEFVIVGISLVILGFCSYFTYQIVDYLMERSDRNE